ncbi:hypothetical protein CGC58_04560 [Capnocytophaga stomatis]|uniref:Uncharacterized protein n=1 Tax=Capnocytophaga stomatis TaxID=1848904 RepID=A0A250FVA9_9FLAO|nr:hypothetical protein [Capnocytophaga stomatis]ATA89050.1 hypothetical protein CGC58_04560 [Capnocytophaga stomatis]
MTVLLLTGAINIEKNEVPFTKLKQTQERLRQYLNSIEYAIDNYETVSHIIFCENTLYEYDYSELQQKAKVKNKILEVLSFQGDFQKVKQQGKGYGEGEIIQYVLTHSKSVQEVDFFYKLTGRVLVKNFDYIHRKSKSPTHFTTYHFLDKGKSNYVTTVFYKISKSLYNEKLLNAHKSVQDHKGKFLEVVFYDNLKEEKIKNFPIIPQLLGVSGSTGKGYDVSNRRIWIESLINKIGFRDMILNNISQILLKVLTMAK